MFMDGREERSLDNMVESLLGQIAIDGPLMQAVKNSPGDAKLLASVVFTLGKIIEELYPQVGRLDARIVALENRHV
jgi:hypothetical protein